MGLMFRILRGNCGSVRFEGRYGVRERDVQTCGKGIQKVDHVTQCGTQRFKGTFYDENSEIRAVRHGLMVLRWLVSVETDLHSTRCLARESPRRSTLPLAHGESLETWQTVTAPSCIASVSISGISTERN